MDSRAVVEAMYALHSDAGLGPLDKAVAARVLLSMDAGGESRLSINAIAEMEGLDRRSVRRAVRRLCERGWLVRVQVGTTAYVYRLGPKAASRNWASDDQPGQKIPKNGSKIPLIRRMDMPRDRAERMITYLSQLQHLYDAATVTEMGSVTEEQRKMWLALSDAIQEDLDAFARHIASYPASTDDTPDER